MAISQKQTMKVLQNSMGRYAILYIGRLLRKILEENPITQFQNLEK
jgi:hypothetical protein